jgi:hypothetical protein
MFGKMIAIEDKMVKIFQIILLFDFFLSKSQVAKVREILNLHKPYKRVLLNDTHVFEAKNMTLSTDKKHKDYSVTISSKAEADYKTPSKDRKQQAEPALYLDRI